MKPSNKIQVFLAVAVSLPLSALPTLVAGAGERKGNDDTPSISQFIKIRWPGSVQLAPDGTCYYRHNPDGLNQLYVRQPGEHKATKLTDFPDGMAGYTLSPDGKHIVISAAVGGNEQNDLYMMDTESRYVRALFAHPDVVYGSVVWRRDSKAFAFRANDTSRSDFHVYIFDLEAKRARKVFDGKGYHYPTDFTSDGKRLAVGKYHSASYSQVFEVNLETGSSRELTPAAEKWAFSPMGYTHDDNAFLVVSNYHGDKRSFFEIDRSSGRIAKAFPQYDAFEADYAVPNEDRTVVAVCLNEGGYRSMHLHKLPGKNVIKGPPIAKGLVGNINFTGDTLTYSLNNARTPGITYKWDINRPASSPIALTEADTQGIDVSTFRLPELIEYKSFDGLAVPAFLYLPKDYQPGRKIRFVISYHGGPEGQYRPSFNRLFQYLVSRGFGVLAPNVRGSAGYGMKYLQMDNYKKRMDSVRDGVAAAKFLVAKGYSTPKQIAAFGGSYGGFMVMACITEAPEMYGAACDVVGIVNFQTFLERTRDYRRKLREAEYGPLSDPAFLKSVSPIYKVDRIQAPLLIAHGENDPRVPIHEARQLQAKMKELNKPVEMITFPDEGHGFRKEKNQIKFYETLADFFERHLK